MNLTPIEFIAQLINEQNAKNAGFVTSTRWLTLRKDLQDKYRREANKMFEDWSREEIEADQGRHQLLRHEIFQ